MPVGMRMRHYPFSHRMRGAGSSSACCWDFTAPDGSGVHSTYSNLTLSQNFKGSDWWDHMWQYIFTAFPNSDYFGDPNVRRVNFYTGSIGWTNSINDSTIPRNGAAFGYSNDPNKKFKMIVSFGVFPFPSKGYTDRFTSVANYSRAEYRNVVHAFNPYITISGKGEIAFGSTVLIEYGCVGHFGYRIDPSETDPVASNTNDVSIFLDHNDNVKTPVLPTIWHQGIQGEMEYTYLHSDLAPLLISYRRLRAVSTNANTLHPEAWQEASDRAAWAESYITAFAGSATFRMAAHPMWWDENRAFEPSLLSPANRNY